eukprot:2068850-Prymnesium_polylepis.1
MLDVGSAGARVPAAYRAVCPILQVSTPSTAHKHCTSTWTWTHPDGTDVWASGGKNSYLMAPVDVVRPWLTLFKRSECGTR